MAEGWIKLHRKLNDWQWKTKPETFNLFIHILLNANHKDGKWRGIDVPAGSYLTGRKALSVKTGLSERQVRTALTHLKSTNELTIQTTKQYSIISITNWKSYQQSDQPEANERPTSDQRATTNKNDNNKKNEKEENLGASPKTALRLSVWMEREGITDIPHAWGMWAFSEMGVSEAEVNSEWSKFEDYWKADGTAKGRKLDWQAAWRTWIRNSIDYKSRRK